MHGTLIVINQNDVTDDDTDSIPVNEPIYIPEYINPINVNIKFKPLLTNLACPMTAEKLACSSNKHFPQKYMTYDRVSLIWTSQVFHLQNFFVDQTLEKLIGELEVAGGTTGIT